MTQDLTMDGEGGGHAARPITFRGHGGITVRGDAWGEPDARPVLLLHGGGQTRHSWSSCGVALAGEGWQAIALDLRGHGETDWAPDAAYMPTDFVADLVAVSDALPQRPVLVGASLGGMTGLLAEGEGQGGVIAGLVLVDVAPRVESGGIQRIVDFMTAAPDGFASLEEAADAVAGYRQHRGRPKDLSGLKKNLRRSDDGRWRWHWDPAFMSRDRVAGARASTPPAGSFNNPERLLAAAAGLTVPTMLVRGRQSDVVSPRGVEEFLATVAHARFVDVSGAGHMVAGDRNDIFNRAVLDFLQDTFQP
jgi:pimeloyl-ACP methyl ester carboxylesterase